MELETIITKGTIKGKFMGFKSHITFEFTDGQKWRQSDTKFLHHYAYNPEAQITQKGGRYYLQVKDVSEEVEVRRIK